jgi:hypothetical protein
MLPSLPEKERELERKRVIERERKRANVKALMVRPRKDYQARTAAVSPNLVPKMENP